MSASQVTWPDPADSEASCTVVIATRNRPATLTRCLAGLVDQDDPGAQVVVVDNSSGDAATMEIAVRFGCEYVVEPRGGLSVARNTGVKHARAPFVLFIDDDAVPERGWVRAITARFADPLVGVVTGRVLPEDSSSPMVRLAEGVAASIITREDAFVLTPGDQTAMNVVIFGRAGIGCNMAFRRELFTRGLLFDERTGRGALLEGGEEQLAFLWALIDGNVLAYEPEAIVRHPVPVSLDDLRANRLRHISDAAGYFALLLVEFPPARRVLLRRALARGGLMREAARVAADRRPRIAGRSAAVVAVVKGLARYLSVRLTQPRPSSTSPFSTRRA